MALCPLQGQGPGEHRDAPGQALAGRHLQHGLRTLPWTYIAVCGGRERVWVGGMCGQGWSQCLTQARQGWGGHSRTHLRQAQAPCVLGLLWTLPEAGKSFVRLGCVLGWCSCWWADSPPGHVSPRILAARTLRNVGALLPSGHGADAVAGVSRVCGCFSTVPGSLTHHLLSGYGRVLGVYSANLALWPGF